MAMTFLIPWRLISTRHVPDRQDSTIISRECQGAWKPRMHAVSTRLGKAEFDILQDISHA